MNALLAIAICVVVAALLAVAVAPMILDAPHTHIERGRPHVD